MTRGVFHRQAPFVDPREYDPARLPRSPTTLSRRDDHWTTLSRHPG